MITNQRRQLIRAQREGKLYDFTICPGLDPNSHTSDFTMNSMWQDETGYISDPHDGLSDLRNGILRMTPPCKINNGFTIRALRFMVTHNLVADEQLNLYLRSAAALTALKRNSTQKIKYQVGKMLNAKNPRLSEILGRYPHLRDYLFIRLGRSTQNCLE